MRTLPVSRLTAALLLTPVIARSQAAPPASVARPSDWLVSANPLGLLYGGLTGEVEHKIGGTRTLAAAVNYWGGYSGYSYVSGDLKLRFYHHSSATKVLFTNNSVSDFEGLSFGPMVGFQHVSYNGCNVVGYNCSATGVTAGGTVDYGIRLGKERQWAVLGGAGVKTGFGFGDLYGFNVTYPFLRLAGGYAIGKKR